jgi:hypothetical protein
MAKRTPPLLGHEQWANDSDDDAPASGGDARVRPLVGARRIASLVGLLPYHHVIQ